MGGPAGDRCNLHAKGSLGSVPEHFESHEVPCAESNTVLRSSAQAKQILAADDTLDHEYLPIAGLPSFVKATSKLIFGADSPALSENRVVT